MRGEDSIVTMEIIAAGQWRGGTRWPQRSHRRRAMGGGDSRAMPSGNGSEGEPRHRAMGGDSHIIQKWTRAIKRHPQRFCRGGDYNAHMGVNACVAKANDQEGSPNKRQRADGRQA